MHFVEGSAIILVSVCLYAWAYGIHHRPGTPAWAHGQLFASVVSLVLVCLVPLGAGLVALGLTEPLVAMNLTGLAVGSVALLSMMKLVPWLARA